MPVEPAVPSGRHQPGARALGDAGAGPAAHRHLARGFAQQSFGQSQFFGQPTYPQVASHPQTASYPRVAYRSRFVRRHVERTAALSRLRKLADTQTYETVFEPNLKEFTQLIPGYMHIRFESTSLVSGRSEPKDDIVDRRDRYYVYLKPHGADDAALRLRMKYAGDPPVYIPMPPH